MCLVKNSNGKSHPPGASWSERPWSTDISLPNQLYRHLEFSSVWLLKERFARLELYITETKQNTFEAKGYKSCQREKESGQGHLSSTCREQNWESSPEHQEQSWCLPQEPLAPYARWLVSQCNFSPAFSPLHPKTSFSFSFLCPPKRGCNKRISSLLMSKVKQRPLEWHVMVTWEIL